MFDGSRPRWQQEIEDLLGDEAEQFADEERFRDTRRRFREVLGGVSEVGVVPNEWKAFLSRAFSHMLKRVPVNDAIVWAFQLGRLWQHWKTKNPEAH